MIISFTDERHARYEKAVLHLGEAIEHRLPRTIVDQLCDRVRRLRPVKELDTMIREHQS